jgi:WD40 repeat protein
LAWSPDGTRLASGDDLGIVQVWDPATESAVATLEGHKYHGRVRAVAWSPDGARLASTGGDRTVRIASPGTLTQQEIPDQQLNHPPTATTRFQLSCVGFTADLTAIAVGSADGGVLVVPLDQAEPEPTIWFLGLPDSGWATFWEDHRYRLVGDPAGRFWWSSGLCRFEPGELDDHGVERV